MRTLVYSLIVSDTSSYYINFYAYVSIFRSKIFSIMIRRARNIDCLFMNNWIIIQND
jgi:hypothetical protein